MEPVGLPQPDFTISIQANEANPFDYVADKMQAIKDWLADHPDAEDILVGQHANEETIPDFERLQSMWSHPLLEKQMNAHAPIRWVHIKLELAEDPSNWVRLVLRADNFYCNGLVNRPDGVNLQAFEFTEETVQGQDSSEHKVLFPQNWKPILLPWNLKYHQLLGCENNEACIFQNLRAMADNPEFFTEAIQYWSFCDPRNGDQAGEAKRKIAGIIFRLCEFIRMKMNTDTPSLMKKVWSWGDISKELRKWKRNKYTAKDKWSIKLADCQCNGPQDALELLSIVLNDANGPEIEKLLAQKRKIPNAPNKDETKDSGSTKKPASAKKHQTKDAGSTENIPASTDTTMDNLMERHVPLGRSRIQILNVSANFEIKEINAHDWHRVQTIYFNTASEVHEADMSHLMLCGPRRAIGAYGHFGIDIIPAGNVMDRPKKRAREGQTQSISDSLNVSTIDDEAPTKYNWIITAIPDRRLEITFLHIPNTVEAEIEVLCNFEDTSEVAGYIKATATGYEDMFVNLFSKVPDQKFTVQSGELTVLPLLLNLVCVPYSDDLQLIVTVDMEITKQGGTAMSLVVFHSFQNKEETIVREFDKNNKIQVKVMMRPDPRS